MSDKQILLNHYESLEKEYQKHTKRALLYGSLGISSLVLGETADLLLPKILGFGFLSYSIGHAVVASSARTIHDNSIEYGIELIEKYSNSEQ